MSISVSNTPNIETGAAVKVVISGGPNDGALLGLSTTDPIAFYGGVPVAQRSGSAQAAVTTTASTSTTPYGFATQAQADALVALVNEIRATLAAVNLFKGGA